MFKWPDTPSARAPEHELADFAELVCWKHHGSSQTAVRAALNMLAENDYTEGVPEEDDISQLVENAYDEIERRRAACRGGYPFAIDENGYALTSDGDEGNPRKTIYRYLLLATRLNMASNRVHADIDGTLLLEEIAADVARDYLGARAESLIFGTGGGFTGFKARVDRLCCCLQEGDGFINRSGAPPKAKDGKLDVVAWKQFSDCQPGKLIAFGQCKTGTHYKDAIAQLQPDAFCRKWLRSPPPLTPVRMFFVAEAMSRVDWYDSVCDGGVLFDRCRIVDFCDSLTDDVFAKVRTWTEAAAAATALPV